MEEVLPASNSPSRGSLQKKHLEDLSFSKSQAKRVLANESSRRSERERILASKRISLDPEQASQPREASIYDGTLEQIQALEVSLQSHHPQIRVQSLIKMRRMLVEPSEPLIQFFLNGKALDIILGSLANNSNAEEQLQAIWCLSTAAAGSSEMCLKLLSIAPYIITFLSSSNETLQEQAAFAVGNLAGDELQCAETLIANGAAAPLVNLLRSQRSGVIKTSCFAISNLIKRQSPNLGAFLRANLIENLKPHLSSSEPEIVSEAFWVLSHLLSVNEKMVVTLVHHSIFPLLITQIPLVASHGPLALPLIRLLGNILCAPEDYSQMILSLPGFLPALYSCFQSESNSVIKETLWVFSNLIACPPSSLEQILASFPILPLLSEIMKGQTFNVRKEAANCLLTISSAGLPFLDACLALNILPEFVFFLRSQDPQATQYALQFFEIILRNRSDGPALIASQGGVELLQGLELAGSSEAQFLLSTYFQPRR